MNDHAEEPRAFHLESLGVQECRECGACARMCKGLGGATIGEIGKSLDIALRGCESPEDVGEAVRKWHSESREMYRSIRLCYLCGKCTRRCPDGIDATSVMLKARRRLQDAGLIEWTAYSSVQVDLQWHAFTAYRAIYEIWYEDLILHEDAEGNAMENSADLAFFPGCSLAAYAPDITRAIWSHMNDSGLRVTLVDECCASPLKSAGLADRAKAMLDGIVSKLASAGVKTIVCACPGCQNNLQAAIDENGLDMRTKPLPEYLLEHPVGFAPMEGVGELGTMRIFRPCQDRDRRYAEAVCQLMERAGVHATVENEKGGCCGAGGAVAAFSRDAASHCTRRSFGKVSRKGSDPVLTVCPTCAYTFASQAGEGHDGGQTTSLNYLEVLFDMPIAWERVYSQLTLMWEGEYAEWLESVLF